MNRMPISLPELSSAYPPRLSAHADQAERAARAYTRRMDLVPSAEAAAHYDASQFGILAGHVYPHASPDRLCLIAEFLVTWAIFDDQLEELPDKHSLAMFGTVTQRVKSLFTVGAATLAAPPTTAAERGLRELWSRMATHMSLTWQQRFITDTAEFLDATRWEAANRQQQTVPDLDAFIDARRAFGGIRMAMDLAELADGYELPGPVRNSPHLDVVLDTLADAALWANDVFSWHVDHAAGNVSNIVTVLQARHGSTVQEAIARTDSMIGHRLAHLPLAEQHLLDTLAGQAPQVRRNAERYLDGVHAWISGNLRRSRLNERYRTAAPP
jgi:epi-isozizaene synthase